MTDAGENEAFRMPAESTMLGRERELAVVGALLEQGGRSGSAMVVAGPAGIGKSSMLDAARRRARERGMRVLSTLGVESESHLPLAGLHQLLRPCLAGVDALPAPQRDALRSAFGLAPGAAPDLFLIALAALTLLSDAAAQQPLLLLADDAHWLDRATTDALAFIARRLESDPIVLLIAIRSGYRAPFDFPGVARLELAGLDDDDARALLAARSAHLSPAVRERLLAEAAGNPLGLVELPRALDARQLDGATELPEQLQLTERLERAFAARHGELPEATRTLLLVAALNDGDAVSETLRAAAMIGGSGATLQTLSPALAAGLIEVTRGRIRFRHPLVRSAIRQAADVSESQAAYAALADVLAAEPDRRVWHRAAAAFEPDEDVASELELAAGRAQRRGSLGAAVAALERAAELSEDPARRGSRSLTACELALELGRIDTVARLVRSAQELPLAARDVGRLAWLRETATADIRGDRAAVRTLIGVANDMAGGGDVELALGLLFIAALNTYFVDRDDATRLELLAACDALPVAEDHPRLLLILAHADPIGRTAHVIEHATALTPDQAADPEAVHYRGHALCALGAHVLAEDHLTLSAERMRREGRLRLLVQVLVARGLAGFLLGRWIAAVADAEEGVQLADETDQPVWKAAGQCTLALLAGARDDGETAWRLAADAERIAVPLRAPAALVFVQMARGLAALGAGRHEDAYAELLRAFDPSDQAHHSFFFTFAIGDLAEAAVATGRRDEARDVLERMVEPLTTSPSPWLQVSTRHARALLADDAHAEQEFRAGLEADLSLWPFARARLQFAQGSWLRRRRRAVDSRAPLRAARDTFDALGAAPWGERARQELRASGERSARQPPRAVEALSPQEFQIAQLAASGLSNREIGQQLFLSHRTVGSHLYRIFPKLGVTSRTDLRAAMDAVSEPAPQH